MLNFPLTRNVRIRPGLSVRYGVREKVLVWDFRGFQIVPGLPF